jgi:hypothetical protein
MRTAHALAAVALVLFAVSGCGPRAALPDGEGDSVPIPELTPQEAAELALFKEPKLSVEQEDHVLTKYDHLDPRHLVPDALLKKAVTYYDANLSHIPNAAVLTVVDFSPHSSHARMFIINMKSGAVTALHVSHGSGSDTDNDGYATRFSNVSGSLQSSLGYYRTAEDYIGKHGLSVRLDGLSSTNSNARARAIVLHSASYVYDRDVKQGRSNGCLAVSEANRDKVMNLLKRGSIIYAALSR